MHEGTIGVALLAASSLVMGAQPAAADCMNPMPMISPAPGTSLPARPVLYRFAAEHAWQPGAGREPEVSVRDAVTGQEVPFWLRALPRSGDLVVHALTIEATHRAVDVHYDSLGPARYWIGDAPEQAIRRLDVRDVHHVSDEWSCSYTEAAIVDGVGNAAAYRLEWVDDDGDGDGDDSIERPRRGTLREAYLPPSTRDMFRWDWDSPPSLPLEPAQVLSSWLPAPVQLTIGHASCIGDTVDPEILRTGRDMRLVALFADGTSEVVGGGPIRVSRIAITLPTWLTGVTARGHGVRMTFDDEHSSMPPAAVPAAVRAAPCPLRIDGCPCDGSGLVHAVAAAVVTMVLAIGALATRRRRAMVP